MEQYLYADNIPTKEWGASYANPNDIMDESIIMFISCESMSEGYWRIKEPSWEDVNGSYIMERQVKRDFNRQLLTLILSNTITNDPYFIVGGEEGVPQNRGTYDVNNPIKSADLTFQVVNLIQEVTKAPKIKGKTSIPRELKEKKSRAPHLHPQTKSKNPRFL